MTGKLLAILPASDPLGPAAAFLRAVPGLIGRGWEVHLVTAGVCGSPTLQPVDGFVHHGLPRHSWYLSLEQLGRRLRPEVWQTFGGSCRLLNRWTRPAGARMFRFAGECGSVPRAAAPPKPAKGETVFVPGDGVVGPAGLRGRVVGYDPRWLLPTAAPANVSGEAERLRIREELSIPDSSVLAVAAAPLVATSRVKDLIWAADLLHCIRDDVHLAILGEGPARRQADWFARQTEAADHVHLPGLRADWMDWIAASDLVWMSGGGDPAWMVAGQAMAMGRPVVAAAIDGLQGLLRHQETALLVPPGSRDGYARWTKYLLEQSASRERLVQQGKAWLADLHRPGDLLACRLHDAYLQGF